MKPILILHLLIILAFTCFSDGSNKNDSVGTDSIVYKYREIKRQSEPFLLLKSGMKTNEVLKIFPKAHKSEDNGAPTLVLLTPLGYKVTLYFHAATGEFSSAWIQIRIKSCALRQDAEDILDKGIEQKWRKEDVVNYFGLPDVLTIPDNYWRYGGFDVFFHGDTLISGGFPIIHTLK